MFRHLRTKLTVLFTGLFGVALILVSTAVYSAVTRNAERMIRDELRASRTVFDRIWAIRTDQLKDSAKLLSRDFGFRAAVASRDEATIGSALANLRARLRLDLAFIVDPAGNLQTVTGNTALDQSNPFWRTLNGAATTSGVVMLGTTPYQAVATPILSPVLAGWVVFAAKLDEKEMRALERLSAIPLDAEVLYREAGRWRAVAEPPAAGDAIVLDDFVEQALSAGDPTPRPLTLSEVASLALAKPLARLGRDPTVLLIRYPMARAMAPYRPLFAAIVAAGVFGILLICIGSWALARSLTRPISALDDATHQLQRGETVAVAVESEDEIGRLARSFNTMAADIHERERRITHLALHDSVTNLPNRAGFERAVATTNMHQPGQMLLIAAIGIDRFPQIRGAIGYALSARLIGAIGTRLAAHLGDQPVGGLATDTLVVAITAPDIDSGRRKVDEALVSVQAPFRLDGETIDVSATGGIAAAPADTASITDLIEQASIAVDQARDTKRKLATFDRAAYGDPAGNLSLISEMLEAIAQGQLTLHHQPKFDLRLGRVTAVEALVRWRHPKRGMLFPGLFIGMAEETGHIGALTHWVLRQAIADQAVLRRAGHALTMSVNLSGRLVADLDFARAMRDVIVAAGADICFEITETAVIEYPELAHQVIAELRAAGIGISIDDYGSGLSSLAYLKTIHADELKIDKAFVMSLSESQNDALVVKSTVDLAHGLGLKVTAEGVETAAALALLQTMGCDFAQGYFVAKPMPLDQLAAFLEPSEKDASDRHIPPSKPRRRKPVQSSVTIA